MAPHGTTTRYQRGKCRCAECREAQRLAMREWRKKADADLLDEHARMSAARARAMTRLARRHRIEYLTILREEQKA